jgi:hypothetical protein
MFNLDGRPLSEEDIKRLVQQMTAPPPTTARLLEREPAIQRYMMKWFQQKQAALEVAKGNVPVVAPGHDPISAAHVCKTSTSQLKEVNDLRKLKTCQVNPGLIIWCTIIRPVHRIAGVWALVEDEAKNVVEAGLYNIAPLSASDRELEEIFVPVGTKIGFKDPYVKAFRDGTAGLRIDHKANVDIRRPGESAVVSATVFSARELPAMLEDAEKLYRARKFAAAEDKYTKLFEAMKDSETDLGTLWANRSRCRLELFSFRGALEDAEEWYKIDEKDFRALFIKAKALRGLRKYADALKLLKTFTPHTEDADAAAKLQKTCEILHEKYLLGKISPQDLDSLVDDYYGSVELRKSAGRGRGLFTTRAVKAGEVLIMERPFARGKVDKTKQGVRLPTLNASAKIGYQPEQESMLEEVQDRVSKSEADAARFSLLYDGSDTFKFPIPQNIEFFKHDDHQDFKRLADTCPSVSRVRDVMCLNAFANEEGSELYIMCSFLNHKARPNTDRATSPKTGNIVILAATDLPACTELTTVYNTADKVAGWGIKN